jgi:hypothetical protein
MKKVLFGSGLKALALLVAVAGLALRARAQIAPYAMFSAGHYSGQGVGVGTAPNQSGGITSLGATLGAYDDLRSIGPIHGGGDARLILENSANSTTYGNKITGFLVGAHVDGDIPAFPVRPYAQVEIGGVGTNSGTSPSRSTSFAYQFQFGADFGLLIPHLSGRLEYGAGQVETGGNSNHTLQTFGAGLVLRL